MPIRLDRSHNASSLRASEESIKTKGSELSTTGFDGTVNGTSNVSQAKESIELYFGKTPDALKQYRAGVKAAIEKTLDEAGPHKKVTFDGMFFSFVDKELAHMFIDLSKQHKNLHFRMIGDWSMFPRNGSQLNELSYKLSKGEIERFEIRWLKDKTQSWNKLGDRPKHDEKERDAKMHHKNFFISIDGEPQTVAYGSANQSPKAFDDNYDHFKIADCSSATMKEVGTKIQDEFTAMWNHEKCLDYPRADNFKKHLEYSLRTFEDGAELEPPTYHELTALQPIEARDMNTAFDINRPEQRNTSRLLGFFTEEVVYAIQDEAAQKPFVDKADFKKRCHDELQSLSKDEQILLLDDIRFGDGKIYINHAEEEELRAFGFEDAAIDTILSARQDGHLVDQRTNVSKALIEYIPSHLLKRIDYAHVKIGFSSKMLGGVTGLGLSYDAHLDDGIQVPEGPSGNFTKKRKTSLQAMATDYLRRVPSHQPLKVALLRLDKDTEEYRELIRAIERGVPTQILLYQKATEGGNAPAIEALRQLAAKGYPVSVRSTSQYVHHKYFVSGDDYLSGSAHPSVDTRQKNNEMRITHRNHKDEAKSFHEEFDRMWDVAPEHVFSRLIKSNEQLGNKKMRWTTSAVQAYLTGPQGRMMAMAWAQEFFKRLGDNPSRALIKEHLGEGGLRWYEELLSHGHIVLAQLESKLKNGQIPPEQRPFIEQSIRSGRPSIHHMLAFSGHALANVLQAVDVTLFDPDKIQQVLGHQIGLVASNIENGMLEMPCVMSVDNYSSQELRTFLSDHSSLRFRQKFVEAIRTSYPMNREANYIKKRLYEETRDPAEFVEHVGQILMEVISKKASETGRIGTHQSMAPFIDKWLGILATHAGFNELFGQRMPSFSEKTDWTRDNKGQDGPALAAIQQMQKKRVVELNDNQLRKGVDDWPAFWDSDYGQKILEQHTNMVFKKVIELSTKQQLPNQRSVMKDDKNVIDFTDYLAREVMRLHRANHGEYTQASEFQRCREEILNDIRSGTRLFISQGSDPYRRISNTPENPIIKSDPMLAAMGFEKQIVTTPSNQFKKRLERLARKPKHKCDLGPWLSFIEPELDELNQARFVFAQTDQKSKSKRDERYTLNTVLHALSANFSSSALNEDTLNDRVSNFLDRLDFSVPYHSGFEAHLQKHNVNHQNLGAQFISCAISYLSSYVDEIGGIDSAQIPLDTMGDRFLFDLLKAALKGGREHGDMPSQVNTKPSKLQPNMFYGLDDQAITALGQSLNVPSYLERMPALTAFFDKYTKDFSLSGHQMASVQHLFPTSMAMYEVFEQFGLKRDDIKIAGKPYSTSEEVYAKMLAEGYHVDKRSISVKQKPNGKISNLVGEAARDELAELFAGVDPKTYNGPKFILLDDGARLIKALHEHYPKYAKHCVALEQTDHGAEELRRLKSKVGELKCPIINMAESHIKKMLEAPAIGENVAFHTERAIEKSVFTSSANQRPKEVCIIGYGAVGQETAKAFKRRGYDVYVYDVSGAAMKQAKADGMHIAEGSEKLQSVHEEISPHQMPPAHEHARNFALKHGHITIECTGNTVLTPDLYHLTPPGAVLTSGGSGNHGLGIHAISDYELNERMAAPTYVTSHGDMHVDRGTKGYLLGNTYAENNKQHLLLKGNDGEERLLLEGGQVINMDRGLPPEYAQLTLLMLIGGVLQAQEADKKGFGNGLLQYDAKMAADIERFVRKPIKAIGQDIMAPDFDALEKW